MDYEHYFTMDYSTRITLPEYSYYKLFKSEVLRGAFFQRLGPAPPLYTLLAESVRSRRTQAKGRIFLVQGRVVTFRPDVRGDPIWPVIRTICLSPELYDRMTDYDYVYIQPSPILGQGYTDLFIPSQRNMLMHVIGFNPTLRRLLQVATWMRRTDIKGRLDYHRPDTVGLKDIAPANGHRGGNIWYQIEEAARSRPNAIIYDL